MKFLKLIIPEMELTRMAGGWSAKRNDINLHFYLTETWNYKISVSFSARVKTKSGNYSKDPLDFTNRLNN